MKAQLSFDKIGLLILALFLIATGIGIINHLRTQAKNSDLDLQKVYENVNYPFCSEIKSHEKIGKEKFFQLIYYHLRGNCRLNKQTIITDFVLGRTTFENETAKWGLRDQTGDLRVFYNRKCTVETGFKGIKTTRRKSEILFNKGQEIKIKSGKGVVALC